MALQHYTKGKIFVFDENGGGGLVAQAVNFSVDVDSNNQPVITLIDGFAGITPGADSSKVNIESAVPRTGFEIDWHTWRAERRMVEITGHRGSSTISIKGFIDTVSEKHGSDGTQASIVMSGGAPD